MFTCTLTHVHRQYSHIHGQHMGGTHTCTGDTHTCTSNTHACTGNTQTCMGNTHTCTQAKLTQVLTQMYIISVLNLNTFIANSFGDFVETINKENKIYSIKENTMWIMPHYNPETGSIHV